MKAAVLHGPFNLTYQDVPDPVCPADGVVVKVEACGICGSDLRTYEGGSQNKIYPSIIGHEIVGEVVETNNNDFKKGVHLAIAPMIPCGECWYCKRGIQNLCDNMREIGLATGIPGGFAEYISLSGEVLKKGCINVISEGVDYVGLIIAEPASSCLCVQDNSNMVMEDLVVIIGAGTIGCLHSEIAKIRGARETIIAELNPDKVQIALQQGFNGVVNYGSSSEELQKMIFDKTEGRGADVVICACPSGEAQADALRLVRKRGKVIFFGGIQKGTLPALNTNLIHYKEITIFGANAYTPRHNKAAFELVNSGRINANKYITHRFGLQELEFAFQEMKKGCMIKGIVIPE